MPEQKQELDSTIKNYNLRWIVVIAISWTLIDVVRFVSIAWRDAGVRYPFLEVTPATLAIRVILMLIASALLSYWLVFRLRYWFKSWPLWFGVVMKGIILCAVTVIINTAVMLITYQLIMGQDFEGVLQNYWYYAAHTPWLVDSGLTWILVIILTQLLMEINEKYSPGVFADIFLGKYIEPREETRIIMFIDLKDSTPIAESLGHKKYFHFIRDFIYYISKGLLANDGRIYQYVGDEVVVSWSLNNGDSNKSCIKALIAARKILQQENAKFKAAYGIQPEFRVGIHIGKVMVGEIGFGKKDLAMSGDAMNTTARIRSAAGELNQKFIVSKDFLQAIELKQYQATSLGIIDLKGKDEGIELFALNI